MFRHRAMKRLSKQLRWIKIGLAALAIASTCVVHAFPPTLPHTIYGMARDEYGSPLGANAVVVLTTPSGSTIAVQVDPTAEPGINYRLVVPLDAGLKSDVYKPGAFFGPVAFRLQVKITENTYLPFQMAGDYSLLGQPGKRTRIDLTLGEDANGNGLPDAWERAIIAARGWELSLEGLNADESPGGARASLREEYIAGTYGFQDSEGLQLGVVGVNGGAAVLEFLAVRGRSYSIMGSTDLGQWRAQSFQVISPEGVPELREAFLSGSVQVLRVEVPLPAGQPGSRFFKLRIQ